MVRSPDSCPSLHTVWPAAYRPSPYCWGNEAREGGCGALFKHLQIRDVQDAGLRRKLAPGNHWVLVCTSPQMHAEIHHMQTVSWPMQMRLMRACVSERCAMPQSGAAQGMMFMTTSKRATRERGEDRNCVWHHAVTGVQPRRRQDDNKAITEVHSHYNPFLFCLTSSLPCSRRQVCGRPKGTTGQGRRECVCASSP